MDLSDAFWLTAAFVVLCGYYIGEKIIDVDFSCFLPKNLKKAKMKRLLAKRSTPLEGTKIKKTIKKAFEEILIPLGKADEKKLPARMDMTFRKNIIGQINKLRQQKLRREIRVTDVTALPKNDFKRWNDDGREWREAVLECCSLERIVSSQNEEVKHEIYRKKACLRVLQSRHIRSSDQEGKRENYYSDKLRIICPSCGAEVKLHSQQVVCEYCGGLIQNDFYDWQTEEFEIYEKISTNMQRFLQLLASMSVLFLCVFLCLYLIPDTEISLSAGVGSAIAVLAVVVVSQSRIKTKQEKLAEKIVRYSENYLRSCLNEYFMKNQSDEDLFYYSVGTIKLKEVVNTDKTTKITADVYESKTYLPKNQKPYTKKSKRRMTLQRARYPERRKSDGAMFTEKDCPSCGANFLPDENGCCSYCGYTLHESNAKWQIIS